MSDEIEKTDSERIEEGQLLVRTIIEMLGGPKEHIEETMEAYVEEMGKNADYEIVKKYISKAEEQEGSEKLKESKGKKLYSLYVEMEIWFKNVDKIIAFCFDSLPSSVEILEPETLTIKNNELSGLLNDLQAKLHKLDMALKTYKTDTRAAAMIFRTLTTNFINYCLQTGKQTPEEIAEITGIENEKVKKLLDELAEKKVIHKKDNTYSLK